MALSKAKSRLLERLQHPRFRSREGAFLVEGIRGVEEALEARLPHGLPFVLVSPRLRESPRGRRLEDRLRLQAGPVRMVEEVEDDELARLSATEHPQGVLLVAEEPRVEPRDVVEGPGPGLLLLDGVQDPGNVGTLLRGAWAFGLRGGLVLEGTADPWNPKAVRAAAGALFHLPVARAAWREVDALLAEQGTALLVADTSGEPVARMRAPEAWALAVGNEGAGVREAVRQAGGRMVSVGMAPGAESLNVGVAGSILLFALTNDGELSGKPAGEASKAANEAAPEAADEQAPEAAIEEAPEAPAGEASEESDERPGG